MASQHADTGPPATRRYSTAAAVAAVGVVIAVAWAAASLVPLMNEIGDLPRTEFPGELVVMVEPGERVVYYERETWFATTPLDPDMTVEVTGPSGQAVQTSSRELPLQYRLPGRVGEAQADFQATETGEYTVRADGQGEDDAVVTVGPSITASVLDRVIGPILVLVVTLIAASVIAARAAAARRA